MSRYEYINTEVLTVFRETIALYSEYLIKAKMNRVSGCKILNFTASYIQSAHKLSEDFAKPYFHKYRTEIQDVTAI